MKNKFTDEDLMAFADKETKGEKAMDILGALLKGDAESKILAKRLAVFTQTRNALFSGLVDIHRRKQWENYGIGLYFFIVLVLLLKSLQ